MAAQNARDVKSRNEARFKSISADIRATIDSLEQAQKELVASIEQPVFSVVSINAFIDNVEELLASFELLRAERNG